MIATWRSASRAPWQVPGRPQLIVFCNPETRRATDFAAAAQARWKTRPLLLPWLRLLRGEIPWDRLIGDETIVRLDSPGKNWAVEKEILLIGAEEEDEYPWRRFSTRETERLGYDPGRIWPQRQWFLGWRRLLRVLEQRLKEVGRPFRWMNAPSAVLAMFDKAETQERLERLAVSVPQALGLPRSFDDLLVRMHAARRDRVFLKPCHGSSASGVVAFEMCGSRMQAWSTATASTNGGEIQLHNHRKVRLYTSLGEIQVLVDAVCAERALAQVWWPKAGWQGERVDLESC